MMCLAKERGFLLMMFLLVSLFSCEKSDGSGSSLDDILNQNPSEDTTTATDTSGSELTEVSFDNGKIQYEGRVALKTGDAAYLYWPGTSVSVKFHGTGIKAILQDDRINSEKNRNHFYIIIDGQVKTGKLEIDDNKQTYTLAENLSEGEHTVALFKLNSMHPGYPRGYAKLYGFELTEGGKLLNPPSLPKRKMEFYGNSITCGVSNEASLGKDIFTSDYENNYWAYGAIVARHFNAQYYCIAKSGIGLIKGTTTPSMQGMYDLVDPFDTNSKWDFSKYTPDIVVVNLLQNDASLIPDEPANDIVAAYKKFISDLRNKYPDAYIICVLGPMSAINKAKWPQAITDAVQQLNDDRVYTYFFSYLGRSGHPRIADDKNMANELIDFIEDNKDIQW